MKSKLFFIYLILFICSAGAEWIQVNSDPVATDYADFTSIIKDGDFRRIWEVTDFKARGEDGESSKRFLTEYDCKNNRLRVGSMTLFSGRMLNGNVIRQIDKTSRWMDLPPDSNGLYIFRKVCAY